MKTQLAIYIGPFYQCGKRFLNFGMTGVYDAQHKLFRPDGSKQLYHLQRKDIFIQGIDA